MIQFSTSTPNKSPPLPVLTMQERLYHWETTAMTFSGYHTILKILCSQSNFNIHLNSHTTAAEISWKHIESPWRFKLLQNKATSLGFLKVKLHTHTTYFPDFDTPTNTWLYLYIKNLEIATRLNQIYFGCFHGKTELNILCLDPTAESKWTENSQLFSSWAKCAICSHEVHLLVATVLQHYHKVPCDRGLVYKPKKILWATESNVPDSH